MRMDMGDRFEEFENGNVNETSIYYKQSFFRQRDDEWKLAQGVKKTELVQKDIIAIRLFQENDDEQEMARGVKKTCYIKQTVSRRMMIKEERWLPKA